MPSPHSQPLPSSSAGTCSVSSRPSPPSPGRFSASSSVWPPFVAAGTCLRTSLINQLRSKEAREGRGSCQRAVLVCYGRSFHETSRHGVPAAPISACPRFAHHRRFIRGGDRVHTESARHARCPVIDDRNECGAER